MGFKDHFSGHADVYVRYRPGYPEALFQWLVAQCAETGLAWDCATGNGQAALSLAEYFDHVVATDASETQIANATPYKSITYRVAQERHSGLPDQSVDLVTVAQALHWFDPDAFFAEVNRVLKPAGVVGMWGYNLSTCDLPLDEVVEKFYSEEVGAYWPPERHIVEREYATLDFPFEAVTTQRFTMPIPRSLPQLLGYLRSWSATKRFEADQGFDPVSLVEAKLARLWPTDQEVVVFNTPIFLVFGRKAKSPQSN